MSILTRFEHFVSGLLEGLFRIGGLRHPGDLAVLAERVISRSKLVLPDGTYAPNVYHFSVPRDWFAKLDNLVPVLEHDIKGHIRDYCQARGFQTIGPWSVVIEAQDKDRRFRVSCAHKPADPE
jgi:hypothetical protein